MRARPLLAVLVLALGVGGCASADGRSDRTVLRVFAASSLTGTFTELERRFERDRPEVDVQVSFGGSADLAAQIAEGAPADVFASADDATMGSVVDEGLAAAEPVVFAGNVLQIAVPRGNPAGVRSIADLAGDLRLVVCAPQVPCGAAAAAVAAAAGVRLRPVSEEQSVADVLGKVRSGEADAGLVYVTDVRAAEGEVEGIAVPEAESVVNPYPIAPLVGASDPALATDFVDLVVGTEGQAVLRDAGFRPAP